jgi:acyl-CoA synthetase
LANDMPEFVLEVSQMPLTASGKIIKRELITAVAEGRLVPLPVRFSGSLPAKD